MGGPFSLGGSDSATTVNETDYTQTPTGSGVAQGATKGNNSANVGPGSLNVAGSGAYYVEAGATNLAGSKGQIGGLDLSKASNVTINEGSTGPSTADASVAALAAALQSSNTTAQTNAQAAAATAQAAAQAQASQTQQSAAPAPVSLWTKLQNWLQTLGVSAWQIAGGVAVVVLLGWLIFHRRKRT